MTTHEPPAFFSQAFPETPGAIRRSLAPDPWDVEPPPEPGRAWAAGALGAVLVALALWGLWALVTGALR